MAYQLYVAEFPNGKRYFGITSKSLSTRIKAHHSAARNGSRLPVHGAIKKYSDKVQFSALAIGERDLIRDLEIEFIRYFHTRDRLRGYNVALGGNISPMMTPEIAAKRKGIPLSPATRAAAIVWHRGRKPSEETRRKISVSLLGNKRAAGQEWPEARRAALREKMTGSHHVSAEGRLRLSKIKKGVKRSPEISEMLSRVHKGKIITEEHRAAISKKLKGRPKSAETRAKISAAHRRRSICNGRDTNSNGRRDGSAQT